MRWTPLSTSSLGVMVLESNVHNSVWLHNAVPIRMRDGEKADAGFGRRSVDVVHWQPRTVGLWRQDLSSDDIWGWVHSRPCRRQDGWLRAGWHQAQSHDGAWGWTCSAGVTSHTCQGTYGGDVLISSMCPALTALTYVCVVDIVIHIVTHSCTVLTHTESMCPI